MPPSALRAASAAARSNSSPAPPPVLLLSRRLAAGITRTRVACDAWRRGAAGWRGEARWCACSQAHQVSRQRHRRAWQRSTPPCQLPPLCMRSAAAPTAARCAGTATQTTARTPKCHQGLLHPPAPLLKAWTRHDRVVRLIERRWAAVPPVCGRVLRASCMMTTAGVLLVWVVAGQEGVG
jgi:hypothetical protein